MSTFLVQPLKKTKDGNAFMIHDGSHSWQKKVTQKICQTALP